MAIFNGISHNGVLQCLILCGGYEMRWAVWFFLAAMMPVQAATYICVVNGKPVYTTQKVGSLCEISDMNGIGETGRAVLAPAPKVSDDVALPPENAAALPEIAPQENDELYHLWHELEYGAYDKVPIAPALSLPRSLPEKPTVAMPNKSSSHQKTPVQAATAPNRVHVAPTLPQIQRFNRVGVGMLNRRQILQQELQREQAALNIAREQLAAARKRNDATSVQTLSNAVLDRERNVLALMREIKR